MVMESESSEWNPPLPPASSKAALVPGEHLESLVSKIEEDNHNIQTLEEVAAIIGDVTTRFERRGLLQGNSQKAEIVLASTDKRSLSQGRKNAQQKRGRQAGNGSMAPDQGVETLELDENRLLSALRRLMQNNSSTQRSSTLMALAMAADTFTAVCSHLGACADITASAISAAEYELLSAFVKPILGCLVDTVGRIMQEINSAPTVESQASCFFLHEVDASRATILFSYMRAAAALLRLFGKKFSRSTAMLNDLSQVGWLALSLPDQELQLAAAHLLVALPSPGVGSDQKQGFDSQIVSLMDSMVCLRMIIDELAPVTKHVSSRPVEEAWKLSEFNRSVVHRWIEDFRQHAGDAKARVIAFRYLINALASLVLTCMAKDFRHPRSLAAHQTRRIDLDLVLNILETMLSFPVMCESMFYTTKKRLRFEPIEGGVIDPKSLAADVSSHVRLLGIQIMKDLLNATGGSVLLPHAHRIVHISYATLFSASSCPLRSVLTSSAPANSKKRRWIHTSIRLRTEAVLLFSTAISVLGCNSFASKPSSRSAISHSMDSDSVDRSIAIVGGSLLEQLLWNGKSIAVDEEWGSMRDRIRLATSAVEAICSSIASGAGFLNTSTRSFVDSLVVTCLESIVSGRNIISLGSEFKKSVFNCSYLCLCTPWPDGSSSSIDQVVEKAATECIGDEALVSVSASVALGACHSASTSRVPPAHFSSGTANKKPSPGVLESAESMLSELIRFHRAQVEKELESSNETLNSRGKAEQKKSPGIAESDEKVETKTIANAASTISVGEQEKSVVPNVTAQSKIERLGGATVDNEVELETSARASKVARLEGPEESDDDFPEIIDDFGPDEGDE